MTLLALIPASAAAPPAAAAPVYQLADVMSGGLPQHSGSVVIDPTASNSSLRFDLSGHAYAASDTPVLLVAEPGPDAITVLKGATRPRLLLPAPRSYIYYSTDDPRTRTIGGMGYSNNMWAMFDQTNYRTMLPSMEVDVQPATGFVIGDYLLPVVGHLHNGDTGIIGAYDIEVQTTLADLLGRHPHVNLAIREDATLQDPTVRPPVAPIRIYKGSDRLEVCLTPEFAASAGLYEMDRRYNGLTGGPRLWVYPHEGPGCISISPTVVNRPIP